MPSSGSRSVGKKRSRSAMVEAGEKVGGLMVLGGSGDGSGSTSFSVSRPAKRKVRAVVGREKSVEEVLVELSKLGEVEESHTFRHGAVSVLDVSFEEKVSKDAVEELVEKHVVASRKGEDRIGMRKWLVEAEKVFRAPESDLQAKADAEVEKFEAREAEVERKRAEMKGKADEDGFVTVVRRQVPAEKDTVGARRRRAKKSASLQDPDFYRFKKREKQIEQLKSLREKFRRDKEKVKKLKQSRKFKPF